LEDTIIDEEEEISPSTRAQKAANKARVKEVEDMVEETSNAEVEVDLNAETLKGTVPPALHNFNDMAFLQERLKQLQSEEKGDDCVNVI
jgi:hypothetical protein